MKFADINLLVCFHGPLRVNYYEYCIGKDTICPRCRKDLNRWRGGGGVRACGVVDPATSKTMRNQGEGMVGGGGAHAFFENFEIY